MPFFPAISISSKTPGLLPSLSCILPPTRDHHVLAFNQTLTHFGKAAIKSLNIVWPTVANLFCHYEFRNITHTFDNSLG